MRDDLICASRDEGLLVGFGLVLFLFLGRKGNNIVDASDIVSHHPTRPAQKPPLHFDTST